MNIKDNSIIICENSYKNSLLEIFRDNKLFLNVKFYSKKEFLANYLFDYKDDALLYLINKYGFKVDIARMYLNNLYYIDETKSYLDQRLQRLVDVKIDLKDNDLIIYNPLFKDFLNNKNIYVLGYSYLDNLEKEIFDSLNANYEIFDKEYKHDEVYCFDNIEKEIYFVLRKVCKLIELKVDINNIKLVNVPSEYLDTLEKLASFYNIPLKNKGRSLYSLKIAQDFFDNFDSDIKKTIDTLKGYNEVLLNKIISICNKYSYVDDYNEVKPLIIDDFKSAKINDDILENALEIVDINYHFSDEEYVFVLNFNMGSIPSFKKNEDFITDSIKAQVHLKTTKDINAEIKNYTINKLQSIKNLTISLSKSINGIEAYPSSLVYDMDLELKEYKEDLKESYSSIYSKLDYAKKLDLYYKYGEIDKTIGLYQNSLDINYRIFDNSFKGISKDELYKKLNNKLTLSYSSFDIYNKCAFRYYLNNILKLDEFSQNFEAFIGSIFHDVLAKCFSEKLDVKKEIDNYIKENNKVPSVKEEFFVNKIIKDITFVIDTLNKQKAYSSFDGNLFEQKIVIDKSKDISVTFMGFVDKILYKKNDKETLIAIVDYKTGTVDTDLKYLPYGFGMQLPIYLYLVSKANLFDNPIFVGFYLQNILDKNITRDTKKTYLEQKENNLKLIGYSINDNDLLERFDSTYNNSKVIASMKTKNDGNFYSYAKVLNKEQIDKIVKIVEEKINEAITNILDGNFAINPKKIGYSKDMGCKFCKFKDICFKKEEDYVIYDEIEGLSFLGGDENA